MLGLNQWPCACGGEHSTRYTQTFCVDSMCLCTRVCAHAHLCGGQKSTSGCFPPSIFRQSLTEPAARIHLLPFPEPLTSPHPSPGVTEAGHHIRVLRSAFEQKALDPLSHFLGPLLSVSFQNWLSHVQRVQVSKHNWKQKPTRHELQI